MVSSPQWLDINLGAFYFQMAVFANGMLLWIDRVRLVRGFLAFDPFDDNTGPKSVLYIDPPPELPIWSFHAE